MPSRSLPIFVYTASATPTSRASRPRCSCRSADGRTDEIDLRLFADYVRGELASGEPLPRLPPLRFGGRFEYHDERLLVGLEVTRYDDQDDVAPFETDDARATRC